MSRSGVYPNWLDAQYVKETASGYGKYGTKQERIEGALEELDTMVKHYNGICGVKKGNKETYQTTQDSETRLSE